jgi:hypothetical protein
MRAGVGPQQFGRTWLAALRLLTAHIDLAKAEFSLIADRAKVSVGLVALAVGLVIFGATLVGIGTPLFLGEWIFGSIGWGILHGFLFALAIAVSAVMLALDIPPSSVVATLVTRPSWGRLSASCSPSTCRTPVGLHSATGSQNTAIALDAGSAAVGGRCGGHGRDRRARRARSRSPRRTLVLGRHPRPRRRRHPSAPRSALIAITFAPGGCSDRRRGGSRCGPLSSPGRS